MSEPIPSSQSTQNTPAPRNLEEGQSVTPRSIHVIINPAAGQDNPILRIMNDVFTENKIDWEIFITKDTGDARRYAQASAEAGVDVIMACGGDGTIMEVASGLRGKGIPLAIMPCGTANVMSIELGIPPDLTESIAMIAEGRNRVRYVDMGSVGNHDFLLRMGVGLEAYMVKETPREAKSRWGNLAYAFTVLSERKNNPVSRYTLNLDGLHVEVEGISLMIANSGNVGFPGVFIAPGVDVSDGLLDAIIIRNSDLPSLLAVATNALLNRTEEAETVLHWQAKKISIQVEPEQPVQADGELIDINPTALVVEVIPDAVPILCPIPPVDSEEPPVQPPGLV